MYDNIETRRKVIFKSFPHLKKDYNHITIIFIEISCSHLFIYLCQRRVRFYPNNNFQTLPVHFLYAIIEEKSICTNI